jgi:hypothetical protein
MLVYRKIFPTILIPLVFLSIPFVSAQAMSVEPMVLEIASVGKGTTNSFKVSNTSIKPLPIEVTVKKI